MKRLARRRLLLSQEPKRTKMLQRLRRMPTRKLEFILNLADNLELGAKQTLSSGEIETLYLCAIPGLKKSLVEGMKTPVSECIPENEVSW